ncbi:hypothetical protein GJ654_10590 [Rhodoblastus acidophilus]|uniref:Flagellar assembly protein FliH/Type III secretion system HrpE domain-containing protein n=1 Tax=Rhodoblastus acidophilus TaxID=1074 RepID=A0A6N8DLI6_RHOAC|nr:hypothetical protein [Rhodoblastus acidophilus]MCW2274974.1 hypothetical protein [Rhodoblastus acidophilus]MTV31442.1 hypothetical protein [Rhodoblastus acidophilus]
MKPVPFAEYLARQQSSSVVETAPSLPWPPPRKRTADEQAARVSPLLRRKEPAPDVVADEPRTTAAAASPKLEQSMLKAFEEGREAARREWAEERARLESSRTLEFARERAKWQQEEGQRLVEAHRAAIADFETRCAQAVANILKPFLTQAVIARVTDSLVQNIEVLFSSRRRSLFEISGPQDLLDALKEKFADQQASIAYSLSDGLDVRVRVDDTVIETQLGAWMQALGALPADPEAPAEKPPARRRSRARSQDASQDVTQIAGSAPGE